MRTNARTFYLQAIGLCCFVLAGSTSSSAGEVHWTASAASSMPNMSCTPISQGLEVTPWSQQWDYCVGTFTYGDGNVYSGQFRHGTRDGFGVLEIKFRGQSSDGMIGWDEASIYVGSFRDDRLNGYGLVITKSGAAYAGTFKDNIAQSDLMRKECRGRLSADWTNCIGTYNFPDGSVYRGEFTGGLPEGIGMLQVKAIGNADAAHFKLPMPGIYVGQFKRGKLSGQGAVVMPNDGYFGTFGNNTFKLGAVARSGL